MQYYTILYYNTVLESPSNNVTIVFTMPPFIKICETCFLQLGDPIYHFIALGKLFPTIYGFKKLREARFANTSCSDSPKPHYNYVLQLTDLKVLNLTVVLQS